MISNSDMRSVPDLNKYECITDDQELVLSTKQLRTEQLLASTAFCHLQYSIVIEYG